MIRLSHVDSTYNTDESTFVKKEKEKEVYKKIMNTIQYLFVSMLI